MQNPLITLRDGHFRARLLPGLSCGRKPPSYMSGKPLIEAVNRVFRGSERAARGWAAAPEDRAPKFRRRSWARPVCR